VERRPARKKFAAQLAKIKLKHVDRAVAFLWFYRQTQDFEERSAKDLADDLHQEGFPRPKTTRLHKELTKDKRTTKGHRAGTFQLDVRQIAELDKAYAPLLKLKQVEVIDGVLPSEWVAGHLYLERMVYQINGAYEYRFFDCCAVLCRRMMESLIIQVFLSKGLGDEIRQDGLFIRLEQLIGKITKHQTISLGRNTPTAMKDIKSLGDTAAHHRDYITPQQDIDDLKFKIRRTIQELISQAGISPR